MNARQTMTALALALATHGTNAQTLPACHEYDPTHVTYSGDRRTLWLGWTAHRGRSERAGHSAFEWNPSTCFAAGRTEPVPTIFADCRMDAQGGPSARVEIPPWPHDPDAARIGAHYGIGQAIGDWLSERLGIHRWKRKTAAPFYDETVSLTVGTGPARQVRLLRAGENWSTQTYYETNLSWSAVRQATTAEELTLAIDGPGLTVRAAFPIEASTREALE